MDQDVVCRACLKVRNTDRMFSLRDEPLKSMFFECTFVKVKPHEDLPFNLCSICVALCDAAYNFRQMSEENDRKIRTMGVQEAVDSLNPQLAKVTVLPPAPSTSGGQKPQRKTLKIIQDPLPVENMVFEIQGKEQEVEVEEEHVEEDEEVEDPSEFALGEDLGLEFVSAQTLETTTSYGCQTCDETFPTKGEVMNHYAAQHPEDTWTCVICGQMLCSTEEWRAHICRRPQKEKMDYNCQHCLQVYKNRKQFMMHLAEKHPGQEYPCSKCDRVFSNTETWRTHMCKGDRWEYLCNYCEASFGFQTLLTRHLKRHLESPTWKPVRKQPKAKECCEVCGLAVFKVYLKQHMLKHTGEKPYPCDDCGTPFRNKHNLVRHIRAVHKKDVKYRDVAKTVV